MAPTKQRVQEMATQVARFRARGGVVVGPTNSAETQLQWRAQAKSFREAWDYLPPPQRTDRLRSGLS
jgi:Asp-tRNA(Asn)/Glu-tRNA(Gln) amidotransferase A subunit family amidase